MTHQLPQAVKAVLIEMRKSKPDLFIYNHLGVNAGVAAWKKHRVLSVMAGLGTEPFSVTEGRTFGLEQFREVDWKVVGPLTGMTPVAYMSQDNFAAHFLEPDSKLFGTSP